MKVEVSDGDLVDKYTIVKIKSERVKDESKLTNINNELVYLQEILEKMNVSEQLVTDLYNINCIIWEIEDKIRKKEKDQEFDERFIHLARSVYIKNDKRAEIKKKINLETNSTLVEEKDYVQY
tara:strand:+ start:1881 stop:2249 length:369 start_codon:yes stop_codon:yes gene_type:complete